MVTLALVLVALILAVIVLIQGRLQSLSAWALLALALAMLISSGVVGLP